MIRAAEINTFIVDIPTNRPHVLGMATVRSQSIVLVQIRTSDGIEGVGEGTTIGGLSYGDESPEGIKLVIDTYIAPVLEHRPCFRDHGNGRETCRRQPHRQMRSRDGAS